MPIYSHSQLSTYEGCPLKYKLAYRDKIKRDVEGVEAFLGSMVHETLRKCYDDARLTKVDTLDEVLACYDGLWLKNWHEGIVISKKDVTQQHYRALGGKMLQTYYGRHAPFNSDITIDTEMRLSFSLDREDKYRMTGFIDRLSRTPDGVYHIHDYKTSAHLPGQQDADTDRQLALYQIGVQMKWPDIKDVRLVWHYLAFDTELVSSRSEAEIASLSADTMKLIDEIESADDFPPSESGLCGWCEYPDLCPNRKHLVMVEALPVNEYLSEPGVALVNKFAELKDKATEIGAEADKVREALIDYAKREGVTAIRGSGRVARVRFTERLRFPGKNEEGREELDEAIRKGGKWPEVSQLDTTALTRIVEGELWDKDLIAEVLKHGRIEETSTVYLAKLRESEE